MTPSPFTPVVATPPHLKQKVARGTQPHQKDVKDDDRSLYVYEKKQQLDKMPGKISDICGSSCGVDGQNALLKGNWRVAGDIARPGDVVGSGLRWRGQAEERTGKMRGGADPPNSALRIPKAEFRAPRGESRGLCRESRIPNVEFRVCVPNSARRVANRAARASNPELRIPDSESASRVLSRAKTTRLGTNNYRLSTIHCLRRLACR